MNQPESQVAAKRDRSPAYPAISLKTASERLTALDEYFKRHPAAVSKIGLAWGMKTASSQASSTVAALKAYGLVDYQGAGKDLQASVSQEGRTYLRAQQESIKGQVLRRAALKPKAIETYWNKWDADRPPNPICLDELVLNGKFSSGGAESFLKIYDATITFAGLNESVTVNRSNTEAKPPNPGVKVGDFIQWESNGVFQFAELKRVESVAETGDFLFVEGSLTGIPVHEVMVMDAKSEMKPDPNQGAGAAAPVGTPMAVKPAPIGGRQDTWNLDEGLVILQYPAKMSATSYEDFESWIQLQLRKIKRGIEQ